LIDAEARLLVEQGQRRARDILSAERSLLEALAATLQEREVMSREEVERLIQAHAKGASAGALLAPNPAP
jgi:cell division protease FtsH